MLSLPSNVIRLRGVTLEVGGRRLVEGLDLDIERGQRWVILGPNGAGKSTLLSVLAGLYCAERGDVQLAGRDVGRWQVEALAAVRALVTDRWVDPFAASALDTVLTARYRFGADDAEGPRRAIEALNTLDCAALAEHDVGTLSRGERQRVALATALAQDAPLLLLDEPTSHQDPRHQQLVLHRLASLDGCTLVASMHDVNAARRLATHVLLLSGAGRWEAGEVPRVLTAERLGTLFGTPFVAIDTNGGVSFQPVDVPHTTA